MSQRASRKAASQDAEEALPRRNVAAMTARETTANVVENQQVARSHKAPSPQTTTITKRQHQLQHHRKAHPSSRAKSPNAAVHTTATKDEINPKVVKVRHR